MANRKANRLLLLAIISMALVHHLKDSAPVTFCGTQQSHRRLSAVRAWPLGRKASAVAPNQNMTAMDTDQVADWVVSLGDPIKQYAPTFRDNGVNGNLLKELTDDDLEDMGVEKPMHRKNILVNREALLADGFNETLHGQRHLESAFEIQGPASLELQPQRFAQSALDSLKRSGTPAGVNLRAVTRQMDGLLCGQQEATNLMEAVEAMNHLTFHRTAHVPGGSRVREEIQSDLQVVSEAKIAAREKSIVTHAKNMQLAAAVDRFCRSCRSSPSDASMKQAGTELERVFLQWKGAMLRLADADAAHNEDLIQRTSARFQSQTPGGAAVQASIQAFSEVMQELHQAAEKCSRIYNLDDPDVRLALEARAGGLVDTIQAETSPRLALQLWTCWVACLLLALCACLHACWCATNVNWNPAVKEAVKA